MFQTNATLHLHADIVNPELENLLNSSIVNVVDIAELMGVLSPQKNIILSLHLNLCDWSGTGQGVSYIDWDIIAQLKATPEVVIQISHTFILSTAADADELTAFNMLMLDRGLPTLSAGEHHHRLLWEQVPADTVCHGSPLDDTSVKWSVRNADGEMTHITCRPHQTEIVMVKNLETDTDLKKAFLEY